MATPDPNNAPPVVTVNSTPPSNTYYVHIPNNSVPKFDGNSDEFQTWKAVMRLHIESVEFYLTTILKDGPYVPYISTSSSINADGTLRRTPKPIDQWSDEDRRLVSLDTKLKTIIISAVPVKTVKSLINFPTAKSMWEGLMVQYEGTDDTVVNRKVSLNKKYESFFALPGEPLSETYTRFTGLLNSLLALGVVKDNDIILNKFLDILPTKWETMILVLRQSNTLYQHTLNSLYGAFLFTEENSAERVTAERNSRNHAGTSSSTGSISGNNADQKGSALLSSEINLDKSKKKIMADILESNCLEGLTDEVDECDDDDLMVLLAKTYNRFKTRSNRTFGSRNGTSQSQPIDKTNLICFKCGKKGHFMKECKSSNSMHSSPLNKNNDDSYKHKYKQLKANLVLSSLNADMKNLSLMANNSEWVESDVSSDEDEECVNLCLMALTEEGHLVRDDISSSQWVDITMRKVSKYNLETDPEQKLNIFDSLACDLTFVENCRSENAKLFDNCNSELSMFKSQVMELKDVQLTLKSQEYINTLLEKEKEDLSEQIIKLEKICTSWSKPSQFVQQCVTEIIPHQARAIIGGDFDKASKLPEILILENESRPEIDYSEIAISDSYSKKSNFKSNANCAIPFDYQHLNSRSSATTLEEKLYERNNYVKFIRSSEVVCNKTGPCLAYPSSPPQFSSKGKTHVVPKKKPPPHPYQSKSGKEKVYSENTVLQNLEGQLQKLTMQVQNMTYFSQNLNMQGSKHFHASTSFSTHKKKNSKGVSKTGLANDHSEVRNVKQDKTTRPQFKIPSELKDRQTSIENFYAYNPPHVKYVQESGEPITRWVPKTN